MDELDNFKDIESSGVTDKSMDLSNVFQIKAGGFGDTSDLKTYLGSVSIKKLKEDISLYETLTKDKSWPVSQIIQREVDRFRVSGISKSYILGEGRLIKYFPPLIIAILPKDEEGKINTKLNFIIDNSIETKKSIYSKSSYNQNKKIEPYVTNAENISLIDGLYVLEVSKVFDTKLLAWDKNKYYAVVIDGQHRLEALFKSMSDDSSVENHLQDVVFIDFSPLILERQELTPVEVVRRIFIDINTNAQRVGFVRQVLMDDKDLASLCVQSMVDSSNRDGSEKNQDAYLKSQIVDWYGDKLKHSLPHLTGVLALHQIIDDFFIRDGISTLRERRNPKKVQNWISRMNTLFMIDSSIEKSTHFKEVLKIKTLYKSYEEYEKQIAQNEEYLPDIDDEYRESEIFEFDYRILDVARDKFEEIYLKPIINFFNELKPYKFTIDIIEQKGGFGVNEILTRALISSRKKIGITGAYKKEIGDLKEVIEKELYPKYYLLYTVLGQKVLFNNLFQRILSKLTADFSEENCLTIVENYLEKLNNLFDFIDGKDVSLFVTKDSLNLTCIPNELEDLGTLVSSFWEGLIYENKNIIYNTQGIKALSHILNEFILINEARVKGEKLFFDLEKVPYLKIRINRILRKRFDYNELQIQDYTNKIIKLKSDFIKTYFS